LASGAREIHSPRYLITGLEILSSAIAHMAARRAASSIFCRRLTRPAAPASLARDSALLPAGDDSYPDLGLIRVRSPIMMSCCCDGRSQFLFFFSFGKHYFSVPASLLVFSSLKISVFFGALFIESGSENQRLLTSSISFPH
jgi:hypothetical protein